MRQIKIAGTDLESSIFSLGGVPLGSKLNERDSFLLMDAYVDQGGNMIDTAQVYANWLPIEESVSEKTIGKWMKSRRNRQDMIVTTKGAHPHLETMHLPRLSQAEILADLEGSLRRLEVDTIDLYWLHRDDPKQPVGAILETLNLQVKAGKIRYFGCSNWTLQRMKEANEYALRFGLQGFSGNQMMWSLAVVNRTHMTDRTLISMDEEMKQFHSYSGWTAIPYSPQAKGLFTKIDRGETSFDDNNVPPIYRTAENHERMKRVRKLASDLSCTVTQAVLGYLISHPFSTIPVIGCHTVKQLEESLSAADIYFTSDQLEYLEKGTIDTQGVLHNRH